MKICDFCLEEKRLDVMATPDDQVSPIHIEIDKSLLSFDLEACDSHREALERMYERGRP